LVQKTQELAASNEELKATLEELDIINNNLEIIVSERTKKLEEQNLQLSEYAFINSHLLRSPVARIHGICDIIQNELQTESDKKLMQAMIDSCKELDTITHKIEEVLANNSHTDYKKLEQMVRENGK